MTFEEIHFMNTNYQTNVYGTTQISLPDSNRVLIATSHGIHSLEFQSSGSVCRPVSRCIPFTYIPAEAEIVSIDAFNRRQYGEGLVIGVCFIKDAESAKPTQFLNIYTATEPGSEFQLDDVANGCRDHALPYFPYQLNHAELRVDGVPETVFLLSGSDQRIHLFREDRLAMNLEYSEHPVDIYFPEFSQFPSNVIWMEIRHDSSFSRRISVTGTQNGAVQLSVVDVKERRILQTWNANSDSPITCVKLFTHRSDPSEGCQRLWQPLYREDEDVEGGPRGLQKLIAEEKASIIDAPFHLLVASALEPARIYADVLNRGLKDSAELPESEGFDCVLAGAVLDFDADGFNEVCLCTYGQTMLIYRVHFSDEIPVAEDDNAVTGSGDDGSKVASLPNVVGRRRHNDNNGKRDFNGDSQTHRRLLHPPPQTLLRVSPVGTPVFGPDRGRSAGTGPRLRQGTPRAQAGLRGIGRVVGGEVGEVGGAEEGKEDRGEMIRRYIFRCQHCQRHVARFNDVGI